MKKVLIVGLDGVRGDLFQKHAKLDLLFQADCSRHSTCGQTHQGSRLKGFQFKTAPGWATVLTGVDNDVHGVRDNEEKSIEAFEYPTIFKYVEGLVLAKPFILGDGKAKGILDKVYVRKVVEKGGERGDRELMEELRSVREIPDVTFIHLDKTDHAGHKYGFESNRFYVSALKKSAKEVKELVEWTRKREILWGEKWLVIVTSDHGGKRKDHGENIGFDDQVPFMMSRRPLNDEQPSQLQVAPTVMNWLKRERPDYMLKGYFFV